MSRDRAAGAITGLSTAPPTVSVVIPTKDRWPLFSRTALRSALEQEDVDYEVIVVDDGSADGTSERLAALREPRLTVIRHPTSHGVARARNAGIAAAKGAWIAFLDDDDLWSPRKLRSQLDAVASSGAAFVYSGAVWVDQDLRLLYGHTPPDPTTLVRELLRWNVVWGGCSNVVARSDVLRELGGFDEELFQLTDWDLWIRLARAGPAIATEDVLVAVVVHKESMLLADRRDVFVEFHHLVAKHRAAGAELGAQPDRALFARWVGRGHVRGGRRVAAARSYLRCARDPGNVVRAAAALLGPKAVDLAGRFLRRVPVHLPPGEWTAVRPGWLEHYR